MQFGLHPLPLLWSIPIALAVVLTALLYGRGWYVLRESLPNAVPAWRFLAFIGGLLSLWAVMGSPLAHLDHELLTAHMAQHLLLMTIAAPLILLGAPAVILLDGFPQRFVSSSIRALQNPVARRLGRILAHPVFCWLAGTVVVIGWHIPSAFNLGMRSEGWHALEQANFFAAGLLFWWPVIQPWPSLRRWPRWSMPLYLFFATLPCDALSAFLTFCGHVVYRSYLTAPRPFGIAALEDQTSAGALMWVWVTFAYVIPAVGITIQILSPRSRASQMEVV
jgi:cytochrome c oxidase assembly factor CtaG